jgi:hypothetical protein
MKNLSAIVLIVFSVTFLISCEKKSSDPDDNASQISGTYYGDYTYIGSGVEKAEIKLTRLSDSTVTLSAKIAGTHRYDLKVKLEEQTDGVILLKYFGYSSSLYGAVQGKQLSYSYGNSNQFIGTKP